MQGSTSSTRYLHDVYIVENWLNTNFPGNGSILRLTKVLPDCKLPFFAQRWADEITNNGSTDVITNHYLSPISEDQVFLALKSIVVSKQSGTFHCGGITEFTYAQYAENFSREYSLPINCFKFVQNGDVNVYNSLSTFLPS